MVYEFFGNGFEDIEAISVLDVLGRGGIEVTKVGVGSNDIVSRSGLHIKTDITDSGFVLPDDAQALVIPGGPGTAELEKCEALKAAAVKCAEKNILLCAVCAAPMIIGHLGLLKGKRATCFPGHEKDLYGAIVETSSYVVTDGSIITAKGAGVSVDFALAVLTALKGAGTAMSVSEKMQCKKEEIS